MPDGFYDRKSDDYWRTSRGPAPEPCCECGRASDVRYAQDPFVAAGVIADHARSWAWWCGSCWRRRKDAVEN